MIGRMLAQRGIVRFAALLLLFCADVAAIDPHQPISQMHHTVWTARDGVSGTVYALAQTTDGFLWLGTDGGLLRFDGISFEQYAPDRGSFSGVAVSSLLATSDGGLWIGYLNGGASFLRRGQVTNYGESDGMPTGRVRTLARDANGAIWAAVIGGVAQFDGRQWHASSKGWNPWRLPVTSPSAIAVDRQGTVFVCAWTEGVFMLTRGANEFQKLAPGPCPLYSTFADVGDNTDRLWIPDSFSFRRFPSGSVGSPSASPIANSAGLYLIDRDGTNWMVTLVDGILRIPSAQLKDGRILPNDLSVEKFTKAQGLTSNDIYCILEDREGNIWLGGAGGLDRFRPRNATWTEITNSPTSIWLAPGEDEAVWASSTRGTVDVRSDKPEPKAPPDIQGSFKDPEGPIWLWAGRDAAGAMWRWEHGQFLKLQLPVHTPVMGLTRDGSGSLWLSVRGRGVYREEQGAWTRIEILRGAPDITAYSMIHDSQGRVWLAYPERQQVAIWDRGVSRVLSKENGLTMGAVNALAEADQVVWAGGESGLGYFRDESFHPVDTPRGTDFKQVAGILPSAGYGLWLNTATGIVHIPKSELSLALHDRGHKVQVERFDLVSDLVEPLEGPRGNGVAAGRDGVLWFATSDGVTRIDPAHIYRNTHPPMLVVRSVMVNGKSYSVYGDIKLPPHTTSLRIGYSVLSLSIPERVRSRYRLLGSDVGWQDGSAHGEVPFNNLGPGKYTFQVSGCNNDGVCTQTASSLAFAILPAFYQTAWFRLLYVAAGATFVWLLYQLRIRQMTARVRLRYTERLAERTRIARDLHDTLLQNLAGVLLQLDGIAKQVASHPDKTAALIRQVRDRVDQSFQEARTKVWNLRSTSLDGQGLDVILREFCQRIGPSTTVRCDFHVIGEAHPLPASLEEEMLRIAQEATRNALQHAHANQIRIVLEYAAKRLKLSICDDGQGFELEEGLRKTDHWGLKNMQERAAQIRATCTIASTAGRGTKVEVIAPVELKRRRAAVE